MKERKNIKKLEWFPETDHDHYDTTRYFINEYNQFPNNTIFVGSNNKKGYLSYQLMRKRLDAANAVLLHRSENFNSGIRKLYFDIDGTVFMLESIYHRVLKDFKKYPIILDKFAKKNDNDNVDILGSLTILHKEEILNGEYRDMVDKSFIKPKNIHTIGMVARDNNGFFLNEVRLDVEELSHELELHYGEGFELFHETLLKKLSENNKGLALLHGKHGTGKSFYIKKLVFDITEKTNKKVVLLPATLINYILEPEFNTFLFELAESYEYDDDEFDDDDDSIKDKGNDGIVLLLEDAEGVLQKRDSYNMNNQSTSNILNLTDGLLNDLFSVQIIATYNTNDDNIDPALLREKRLIAKREFKDLTLDESKALGEHLKVNKDDIENEMSVAEIYSLLEKEENNILIDKGNVKKGKHLI